MVKAEKIGEEIFLPFFGSSISSLM